MRIARRPTEIEEGEIVDDVYPHDLLVNDGLRLEPEPFIRAPVISYEAAVIMEEVLYEAHWDKQYQEGRDAAYLAGVGEEYEFER